MSERGPRPSQFDETENGRLLADRVAIVTGANSGIGLGIATKFLRHGARVVGCDLRLDSDDTKRLLEDAAAFEGGATYRTVLTDVRDPSEVGRVIDEAIAAFGRVDILVNSAGILLARPVVDFPLSDWRAVFAVNMEGTFLFCQAVARRMIEQGIHGAIVNIGSAASRKADPEHAAYAASKAAVVAFSRVLALELGPHGIRVNAILPGATETPMFEAASAKVAGLRQDIVARTVIGRLARVEDQANAALFLASDLASHITGEYLVVSGGEFMNP